MNEEFFEELQEKIMPYFEGINPCHDFFHTKRVLDLALNIGESEECDLDILRAAALLHDVGRKAQDECCGKICHAEEGGRISREILKEIGCSDEFIRKVVHCVEAHRFRKDNIPESIEAKVLYDADKLDAIGGIGILRATSFAGFIGAHVHNADIDVPNTKAYSKDDSAYREFLVKLIKIKDKMLTVEGRRVAEGRHKFMEEFFERVNAEVAGGC